MASEKAIEETPKEVIVGPYRYSVSYDGEASYDYHFLGVCLERSRRVKLDPRQSDTELPQTLLHELLHAIGQTYEIKAWEKHTTNDKNEIIDGINMMASALLQFMRTNPNVIQWLQEQK